MAAGEDVGAAVAEALPDQPQVALRVAGQFVLDVGLRRVGQAFGCRPRAVGGALQVAAVEVEVAVHLLGPDNPGAAPAVAPELRHQAVARFVGDLDRRLPGRAVEAPRHDRDTAVPVGGPGRPDLAVLAARHRREIVLDLGRRQRFRRRDPVGQHGAVEECEFFAHPEVGRPQIEVAVGSREGEPRPRACRHVDDDARVVEVGHGALRVLPLVDAARVVHPGPGRHRPARAVDRLRRMDAPVAQRQQIAAGHFDGAVPGLRFAVRDPEPHPHGNDVVAGQRRDGLCTERAGREERRGEAATGWDQGESSGHAVLRTGGEEWMLAGWDSS